MHWNARGHKVTAEALYKYLEKELLPVEGTGPSRWREFVRAEASKNDYFFVDLVEEMRTFPGHTVKKMFRKGGHYSDEGNRYVAEVLYKKLMEIPEISGKLQRWSGHSDHLDLVRPTYLR
jgi:hypothetical protein